MKKPTIFEVKTEISLEILKHQKEMSVKLENGEIGEREYLQKQIPFSIDAVIQRGIDNAWRKADG